MRRKTSADYRLLAEKRGFRWLGFEATNTHTKTSWACEQGHQWQAPYSSIQQGRGCPVCAGRMPKTAADYRALAEKRGFHLLGPEASNTKTKTNWGCEQGHRWEAPYHNIQQGHGCPICAGNIPKTSIDYHALAEKRGFRWLGPKVSNVLTKTGWECEQGHQWKAPYNSIQQERGCPVCAGKVPKSPVDYHALAEERGFRWLGPGVADTMTRTSWECEQRHRWETPYSSIQQGRGCPVCAGRVAKTPADYHALAEERGFLWLGPEVADTKTKTSWECEKSHRWEAPFNSIQQGRSCPFCAGLAPKTTADYRALAKERGFCWLGPEVSNTHTKTSWECEKSHRWEAPYSSIQQGSGCPFCAGLAPKTPADYHDLAKERGFHWLGPEVSNTKTKTSWECAQGHHWEAPYHDIQQGYGCLICAGKAPKTPADYHDLVKERGIHWLGPKVPNVSTKTSWKCEQGHRGEAPYSSIQQGSGCPFCAGLVPKIPADYHDLARERGFHWLGPEVSNSRTKTGWECKQGPPLGGPLQFHPAREWLPVLCW
jgi:L-alanine-DL-glutamate epimerase-like enolase superfamily enzyme